MSDAATGATAPILADYLDRDALASELSVTPRTIARWEAERDGLPTVRLGGRPLYRRASVLAWLESRERHRNPVRRANRAA